MSSTAAIEPPNRGTLKRALRLSDLILYGIVVIQPVAPMSSYGVLSSRGKGHVVTAILIAMVAMLLTALSYGRMARAYPSAGSAFTYVGKELHPALGYVTGWSMVMDYVLNPTICIVWCSKGAMEFVPEVPYAFWALAFFGLFTWLNLRGVEASARFNAIVAAAMGCVILVFFVMSARFVAAHAAGGAGEFTTPFYDARTWHTGSVLNATSVAVLTFIGFDGISTLSEEVENPRRNVLLATVLTCFFVGVLAALEVYAAQLVWPASEPYPSEATAFAHVAGRTAPSMFAVIVVTLLVANAGSGVGSQLGAARLLYGMGRSGALSPAVFGYIDPKRRVPRNNVWLVGAVALAGAFGLEHFGGYDLGAQLLNFGALIAFMGVNLAAFVHYFVRRRERTLGNALPPLVGFAVCLLLWINLSTTAQVVGAAWMAAGVAFGAVRTRGFRRSLVNFDTPP
ncbi:MAG TPA: APC family permease [Polyangiaceae bacterium]|nr:APC family permease [Polyangiaceae bacterium]